MRLNPLRPVTIYGRMIKFSHSVFALPFALSGAALAASVNGITLSQIGWIIVAMVSARSAAMGFNRIADRTIDAANPRTSARELPTGLVSLRAALVFVVGSAVVLVYAASQLNTLCLYLSPVALGVVLSYSLTKRFTWLSHVVLGLSLCMAPLGAWIAVTGTFAPAPVALGVAVLAWVAGFDILYACQDFDFDTRTGLHSIPVRFGLKGALLCARLFHGLAIVAMVAVGYIGALNGIYLAGIAIIAGLLVYEHYLVRADDLTRVNMAFMTMNTVVSILYFGFTLADLIVLGDPSLTIHFN
jgi:4-hydroxybenzoate polyprenyltransferase